MFFSKIEKFIAAVKNAIKKNIDIFSGFEKKKDKALKSDSTVQISMDGERVTRLVITNICDQSEEETATQWVPSASDGFGDLIRLAILEAVKKNATDATLTMENMVNLHGATLTITISLSSDKLKAARAYHGMEEK